MIGTVRTASAEQTMALGEELGRGLQPGDVVALFGDLGAGKTTLTKGLARGLGVQSDIHSPSFVLIHEHPGPIPLYHIDLYRLSQGEEVETLGIEECLEGGGVTVIEWADRMTHLLPPDRLDIMMRLTGDSERELTFETSSERLAALVEAIC